VTVEAKADEPFDELVSVALSNALETLLQNPRSGKVDRIVELAQSLFRPQAGNEPPVTSLRYQLLTATAGTLAHAIGIGADRAVLMVHEFVTSKTAAQLLAENHADLSRFVARLSSGSITSVETGVLYGPFALPGEPLFEKPAAFYVGKAVRRLGQPRP
jgi:hypothetical protein